MPLDASRNSLVLPLLGLLVEQPAHAYDLASRLTERYRHLHVTRSTVTTLLKSMERAGVITPLAPKRVDGRPPRVAYALTDAGFTDFRGRIEAGLRGAQPASIDFVMAVSYAAVLPAGDVADILEARADGLADDESFRSEHPPGLSEAHMLEMAYWRTVVGAEADWIGNLAARIRSRDITWPTPPPPDPEGPVQ
ncbi:MAG TPA: helix-turn-helix transcriptional regulator [Actinoplanes sp.]